MKTIFATLVAIIALGIGQSAFAYDIGSNGFNFDPSTSNCFNNNDQSTNGPNFWQNLGQNDHFTLNDQGQFCNNPPSPGCDNWHPNGYPPHGGGWHAQCVPAPNSAWAGFGLLGGLGGLMLVRRRRSMLD